MYVGLPCGQSAHVGRSEIFYDVDVGSRRCGCGFARVRWCCLSAVRSSAEQGWSFRKLSVVSTVGLWQPATFGCVVAAFLLDSSHLDQACVSLGVRGSSAMRFHRVGFKDCLFQRRRGRLAFVMKVSLADVDSVSNMLRICKFMCSFEHVCCQMSYIVASRVDASRHDL